MPEVRLELLDGHLIADAGPRLLLDTGSPASFSNRGSIQWAGRDRHVDKSALGLDADELSRLVGTPLDGLVGGDLLSLHPFTVDLERGVCGFREPASDPHTTELRVELARGVPVATVELDGAPTRTCVDTGAKLSYLEEAHTRGLEPVDVADDFYPAFGTFRTPIYEIPVRIGEAAFTMRVGSLPSALSSMLGTLGIAAILGTGVFRRFPVVRFDYSAARITLRQGMAPEAP